MFIFIKIYSSILVLFQNDYHQKLIDRSLLLLHFLIILIKIKHKNKFIFSLN
jgi:hypothetical protein